MRSHDACEVSAYMLPVGEHIAQTRAAAKDHMVFAIFGMPSKCRIGRPTNAVLFARILMPVMVVFMTSWYIVHSVLLGGNLIL